MKNKFKKFISMFVMLFMVITLVAGCGDKEITSLKVKEGTLEYVYKEQRAYSGKCYIYDVIADKYGGKKAVVVFGKRKNSLSSLISLFS